MSHIIYIGVTMVKVKELSPIDRAQIVTLRKEELAVKAIASRFGISQGCVYYTLNQFKKENSFERTKVPGRPPALTRNDEQFLKVCSLRGRRKTVPELCDLINTSRNKKVGVTTVRKAL